MKTILHHGLMALTCLLMTHSGLAGQTRPVRNTHDGGADSLRYVISISAPGDTIIFEQSAWGSISLTNTSGLVIDRDLTIIGPGATNLTISAPYLNRMFIYRLFTILSNTPARKVTISGLTISGGIAAGAAGTAGTADGASGQGGGIFNAGNLTLTDCIISGNTAIGGAGASGISSPGVGGDGVGGGIYSSGTIALTNCTLFDNNAIGGVGGTDENFSRVGGRGSGAGIYLTAGSLVNCTIAGNTATGGYPGGAGSGGGVCVAGTNVTIISCTISGNNSAGATGLLGGGAFGGGIYVDGSAAPTLGNTIVAGNTVAPNGNPSNPPTGPDVDGSVTDGGFNLIGRTDGSSGWVSSVLLGGTTDGSELNPQLGPLQDNGGPTPTMALGSTSAAIDASTNFGFNTDQRGILRPFDWVTVDNATGGDASDIGAYELFPQKHRLTISRPVPVGEGTLSIPLPVYINWPYALSPGTGAQATIPVYTLQSTLILSPTAGWGKYTGVVKPINGQLVARDTSASGSSFYRLKIPTDSTMINTIIRPPVTGPANTIRTNSATFTGSLTPAGTNTVYWFEYGTDTNNYSQTTQTNILETSLNQVDLSLSVPGLALLTLYHFQLVVMDDWGAQYTQYGGDRQFTTLGPLPRVVAFDPTYNNTDCGDDCVATAVYLSGTVNAEGSAHPAHAYFEYGTDGVTYTRLTDSSYFTTTSASDEPYYYTLSFTGLLTNTTYYYRTIAFNDTGTGTAVKTLTTPP